jgi:hypothetical protein
MLYTYIQLDNEKYVVQSGTYIRKWERAFTSNLAANLIRLNWVDRGPGIKTYTMTLYLVTWGHDSIPYKNGITKTAEQQLADLETSYEKIATALQFFDPFGQPPNLTTGIFFQDFNVIVPNFATTEKPYVLVDITLIEASGTTI